MLHETALCVTVFARGLNHSPCNVNLHPQHTHTPPTHNCVTERKNKSHHFCDNGSFRQAPKAQRIKLERTATAVFTLKQKVLKSLYSNRPIIISNRTTYITAGPAKAEWQTCWWHLFNSWLHLNKVNRKQISGSFLPVFVRWPVYITDTVSHWTLIHRHNPTSQQTFEHTHIRKDKCLNSEGHIKPAIKPISLGRHSIIK